MEEKMVGTIYAIKADSGCDILASLKNGVGRFGWSYIKSADLRELKKRINADGWASLSPDEKDCYHGFLLNFKAGDYVVYINAPEWGKCTVAEVTGEYFWQFDRQDFNHRFPVDPSTVCSFDRNDAFVHPALSCRLKLRGSKWKIYLKDEFFELLVALKSKAPSVARTLESNRLILAEKIQTQLLDITRSIQHTHPNTDLEGLLADVFKQVPGVEEVEWKGGAGDHGADLLVKFNTGLPIPGLEEQSQLVVQIKSYEGEHRDVGAVNDIKRAFDRHPHACMGLIISTANSVTKEVKDALDKLRDDSGKPVAILLGADVAKFVLSHGAKLLGTNQLS